MHCSSTNCCDTQAESTFDDLTRLAAHICEVPIALMVLVDDDRQWLKSRVGLDAQQTPREHAFCAHTILQDEILMVEDGLADVRFATNPLVTGDPHIGFYGGAPLINADGQAVGTLGVIDREPRQIRPDQVDPLVVLARQVIAQMELRRVASDLAEPGGIRPVLSGTSTSISGGTGK